MHLDQDVITALEKARSKGVVSKNKSGRAPEPIPSGRSDDASGVGADCG